MADQSSDRIRELFEKACDLEPSQRKRLLDEECADDPGLRAEVESLLAHDPGEPAEPRRRFPERIGPYRLLEKIGEGGMGVVFLAEREDPRRRVALKLIKPGMDSERVLARFEAERQALALMNHRNVAAIYDAGTTPEGRPYFVMEYVAGIPVTEHCDRHRLRLRERLELCEQICQGVHHAHQKGIIHRDLKPTNVLVQYENDAATPKIIDFGVAKALHQPLTERSFFTDRGHLVGTPEYMSPEQAQLTAQDIDIRSDVYSLGVLLYELLTGALPFDREAFRNAGLEGMLRLIRDTDPPRPSTRFRTLETKDPTGSSEAAKRRSIDPRTLTRRLRDDLDWITMMCLEKDRSRRYESATALADDIRRHLNQEPVRARPPSAAYRARKFWRRHRVPLAASSIVAAVFLAGVVTVTALTVSRLRIQTELDAKNAVELVEQASLLAFQYPDEATEKLARAIGLDPTLEDAYLERARLRMLQNRRDEAIEEARGVLSRDPESGAAAALLAGLLKPTAPGESARYAAEAERLLELDELYAALALGEDDTNDAIELLTKSLDKNPWNFTALWQRAVRLEATDDLDGALRDAELMTRVRSELSDAWNQKGAVLLRMESNSNDDEEKERLLLEAKAALDEAIARDPDNWRAVFNRGIVHRRMGAYPEALEDQDRAIELEPDEPDAHKERGYALRRLGRADEAVSSYQRVIELGRDDWGSRWDLGSCFWDAGNFERAASEFSAALDDLPGDGAYDKARGSLLRNRAEQYLFLRRFTEAQSDLELLAALDDGSARLESMWGRLRRLEGRYDEAYPRFNRAVERSNQDIYYTLERGITYWRDGKLDRAVSDLTRFAEAHDTEGPWTRLLIWEIEKTRGNNEAATEQLRAARATSDAAMLSLVVGALLDEVTPQDVTEAAEGDLDRLRAFFSLGSRAVVRSEPEQAAHWFRQCASLGMSNHLEHELAEWRLAGLPR